MFISRSGNKRALHLLIKILVSSAIWTFWHGSIGQFSSQIRLNVSGVNRLRWSFQPEFLNCPVYDPKVVNAQIHLCSLTRPDEVWNCNGGKHTNDGYYNHDLHESKAMGTFAVTACFHFESP